MVGVHSRYGSDRNWTDVFESDICRDPKESIRGEIFAPHYTNERFKEKRSIYLAPGYQVQKQYSIDNVKGAFYNYSDRLYVEYLELWNQTCEKLIKKYPKNSAIFYSKLLSLIYKKQVEVVHILSGYNTGNGYPYQVFGTIDL